MTVLHFLLDSSANQEPYNLKPRYSYIKQRHQQEIGQQDIAYVTNKAEFIGAGIG